MVELGRDTGEWSTRDQELDLMAWLENETSAKVVTVGHSVEGREIFMVTFGDTESPGVFIAAGVHGREPASREGALGLLRDLGESSSLPSVPVSVVANVNPDGREANTRENAHGVDLNRDAIHLRQPESRSVNYAVRTARPVVIVDLHEAGGGGRPYDYWALANGTPGTYPDVQSLGDALVEFTLDAVRDDDYDADYYWTTISQSFRANAGHYHAASLLVEPRIGLPYEDRIALTDISIQAAIEFTEQNIVALEDAQENSINHALTHPGPEIVNLSQNTISPGAQYEIQTDGYWVLGGVPPRLIAAFELETESGYVPIDQWARGFLPELFDPESRDPSGIGLRREPPERPDDGLTVPFTIDAVATSGQIIARNSGNADAPARLEVHGPVQSPQVTHVESGRTLVFDLILDAGQWLEVDLDNHTVMLNGQASRRGRMRGDWFDLAPGVNTLLFNATNDDPDAQLVARWRDAYR